jgi:8-oxo-dGTP pyrophosphatase MutT (NUDIX family)
MNRGALMNKIASFVTDVDKSLPYRRRVEVAIFKDGKVLLTKNKDKETGDTWYGFPGGGTDGDTDEVAARKECLEEVGVSIENLQRTEIFDVKEGIGSKDGRDKRYRGSRTRMFTADFKGKDLSKLGADGDPVKYVWSDPSEAKKLLKDNKINSTYRVKTLESKKES